MTECRRWGRASVVAWVPVWVRRFPDLRLFPVGVGRDQHLLTTVEGFWSVVRGLGVVGPGRLVLAEPPEGGDGFRCDQCGDQQRDHRGGQAQGAKVPEEQRLRADQT
jgi:hypothetical protein